MDLALEWMAQKYVQPYSVKEPFKDDLAKHYSPTQSFGDKVTLQPSEVLSATHKCPAKEDINES